MMRNIQPASLEQIEERISGAYSFAAAAEDHKYGRGRGAEQVLAAGQDYAGLPGFGGRSAREIIESLPKGSKVLDVGCGYGQLGAQILGAAGPALNAGVEVYGFDAQAQPGQERLTGVVIGNVDDLSPETFSGAEFALIFSSALLYHLPDYWGALLRMSRLLRPEGVLLASTMPRVVRDIGEPVDDERGLLTQKDTGNFFYFRNRNVFTVAGEILPPGAVVGLFNRMSAHFVLEYRLIDAEHISGVKNVGGGVSGRRLSAEGGLDASYLFYCLFEDSLGYIAAQTEEERESLKERGFISLPQRL